MGTISTSPLLPELQAKHRPKAGKDNNRYSGDAHFMANFSRLRMYHFCAVAEMDSVK